MKEKEAQELSESVHLVDGTLSEYVTALVKQAEDTWANEQHSLATSSRTSALTSREKVRAKAMAGETKQLRHRRHRGDEDALAEYAERADPFEMEASTSSPSKRKQRKNTMVVDALQEGIIKEVHAEQRKTIRLRRETIESAAELNESDLIQREVEMDVSRKVKATPRQKKKQQRVSASQEVGETSSQERTVSEEELLPTRREAHPSASIPDNASQISTTSSIKRRREALSSIISAEEIKDLEKVDKMFAKLQRKD
jgi:hypothetical protein